MAAKKGGRPDLDLDTLLARVPRPKRLVVTAGMPYANGPLHLGHLAGAHLPADIFARFQGMVIGRENVLFVCGNDDHGSTSEIAAMRAGKSIRDFLDEIHEQQTQTMQRYAIGLDIYSGTSQPETFPVHEATCQDFLTRLHGNGLLSKRASMQWFDPKAQRFLPDRFVRGTCPNPKCGNPDAYSDECDVCGHQHQPDELIEPRSSISDATPEMRETLHWWLDMWQVSELMREWIQSKTRIWRKSTISDVLECVLPSLHFDNVHEAAYREIRSGLPEHKMKYAPGKQVLLQFKDKDGLGKGRETLEAHGLEHRLLDEWAHRSITRDISWGVPLPAIDPELAGKTLYVWPESLIAPISFSRVALAKRGEAESSYREYWCDPESRIVQFLGQDNVFFYVLMQAAMWLGSQEDPQRMPVAGEYQLTDIISSFHLMVGGEKMSKSKGNFFTGDQLLDEKGYDADQIRYYMAILGLSKTQADFDFEKLDERNRFLAGPLNAAFERPISAAHSKFAGKVPSGKLVDDVEQKTLRIVQRYLKSMGNADYPTLVYELENYARTINSLFNRYKPHDDRHPEEGRRDALYSSFYLLKSLMIMLYPFVPETMERLRASLRLPESVWRIEELGTPIPAGHELGEMGRYFPALDDAEE
ncbi:MAG: methionine--tRNA ligase [Planctomycetota bacterium]|nr:MAG: methionine--tRNA ligase [Planctomycetota bacterium]